MKISIIVPIYNVEEYLEQCIQSIVDQTIQDKEIILVNDGSPDNSQLIIDRFVEKYPTLIQAYIKENGGLSSARNFGMKYAKGEFIGFVDSDDWIDSTMYEEMVSLAEEKNADIVICDMNDHYPDHVVYHKPTQIPNVFGQTANVGNKLFRRSFIEDLQFIHGYWYEDLCFTAKLLAQTNKIERISKDFYHFHCRSESIMTNHNAEKNLDILVVMDDICDYLKERDLYQKHYDDICLKVLQDILIAAINRVAIMENNKKDVVIGKMINYCKQNYPGLLKTKVYASLPRNRRIIAWLNWHGKYKLSRYILQTKKKFKL